MKKHERKLYLDICDYSKKKLCMLYDNSSNVSGQAADIFVTTERNGWKELSFTLPSVCHTEDGIESNYRIDFLKADFLIRLIDDDETDWFIISEPKIKHNAFAKTIQVTAGHNAQLLKLKNLGLEFSDDAGNNVGTAAELAETILQGTGWNVGYVYPFAEKDGSTKYRSLKASAKTGAFKLIATMCDLFDAKPIYHGDNKTVDIVPINPFSEPAPGSIPDLSLAKEVVELHYGTNVDNVERTLNTDNVVTKLYAYGSYGDKTSGYCGIDECVHVEHIYELKEDCKANQTYFFTYDDSVGVSLTYHFTPTSSMNAGSKLIYSLLDPCSMMYIWDDNNQKAYPVTKGTVGVQLPAEATKDKAVQNWFQFVMNFDYYRESGLLTDDMIQIIGNYQRTAPLLYKAASDASLQMSDAQTKLSETIGYIDFCKLDIEHADMSLNNYVTLKLNKNTYQDGVVYRTDYDKSRDNYFKWRTTDALNVDGDPVNTAAGVLYIIHDTNPVTWDKAYLKEVDDEDNPSYIVLWMDAKTANINPGGDQFYLFSYNGINGHLGTLESNDEAAVSSLEEAVRVVTVDHPVIFTSGSKNNVPLDNLNGYGWLWQYSRTGNASNFYFAFTDEGDNIWQLVYFQDYTPTSGSNGRYWFDWRNSVLYRMVNSKWVALTSSSEQKIAALFATVFMYGKARDRYYQGVYENYTYTVPAGGLPAGNYLIENEYNSYWTFTTTSALSAGDTLTYNYDDAWITQIKSGIESTIKPKGYRFDNVNYHPSNILAGCTYEDGYISDVGAIYEPTFSSCRSQSYISVVPSTKYIISNTATTLYVHFYDEKQRWLSYTSSSSSFMTPGNCTYIRVCARSAADSFATASVNTVVTAENAANIVVIEDLNYIKLSPISKSGDVIGLISCINKFTSGADSTYITHYNNLQQAQKAISDLEKSLTESIGDLYREGWWSDASYVDGDELKLYDDALDNLQQIAHPEATYNVNYLDTYESNSENQDYGAAPETVAVSWPDLSIMSAVHLVDPEIAVNTWAFIDKVQKCFDKPWQTKIVINTNLSTIAQHSFTDVMTHIASVASEMKGKTSYYDKTIGSAVNSNTVIQLSANVVKTEKNLLSAYSKIEQYKDALIKKTTSIEQTAEGIKLTAQSVVDGIDKKIDKAIVSIEPDRIMSVVEKSVSYNELVNQVVKANDTASSAVSTSADAVSQAFQSANAAASAAASASESKSQATAAQTAANTAKNQASTAQTAATNAQTAATNAQTAAEKARQEAEAAKKAAEEDAAAAAQDAKEAAELSAAAQSAVNSAIATAQNKNKIYAQTNAPASAVTNDLWIDTNDGNKLYRYNGSSWVSAQDNLMITAANESTRTSTELANVIGLKMTDSSGKETMYAKSAMKQTLDSFTSAIYDSPGGNVKSILSQTENTIVSAVKSKSGNGLFSYVAITDAGIEIKSQGALNIKSSAALNVESGGSLNVKSNSNVNVESSGNINVKSGGNVNLKSGAFFSIESGGSMQIKAGGSFTVDSGNFDLDANGRLYATDAVLSGDVFSGGHPVLTKNDIFVSTEPPSSPKTGMIWIKPGVPSSSGSSSTTTSVVSNYRADFSPSARSYIGSSESASTMSVTLTGSGTASSSTSCTYTVLVPIYIQTNASSTTGGVLNVKISNGSKSVTLTKTITQTNPGSGSRVIELSGSSSSWIGTGSSITIKVWATTTGSYNRGNILNNRGSISVSCYAN